MTPVLDVRLSADELAVLAFLEGRQVPESLQPVGPMSSDPEVAATSAMDRLVAARDSLAESELVDVVDDEAFISPALRELLGWLCEPEWAVEGSVVGAGGAANIFRLSGTGPKGTFASGTADELRLVSGDAASAVRPVLEELLGEPAAATTALPVLRSDAVQIPGWEDRHAFGVVATTGEDEVGAAWLVIEGNVWHTVAIDSAPHLVPAPSGWLDEALSRVINAVTRVARS